MNANTNASQNQKSSIIDHQSSIPNPLEAYVASLAEIADIFQIPTTTPPPVLSQLRSLLDERLDQLEAEFQARDQSDPDIESLRAIYYKSRTRIWAKILQLNEAHRNAASLKFPTEFSLAPIQPAAPHAPEPLADHTETAQARSTPAQEPHINRTLSAQKPHTLDPSSLNPIASAIYEKYFSNHPKADHQATPPNPNPDPTSPPPRPHRLDQLSEADKALVASHIEDCPSDLMVARRLSAPRPSGLGIPVTRFSVHRFRIAHHADLAEKRQRLAQRIRNRSIEDADTNDDYREAALNCFHARLFEAAIDPNCSLKEIPNLARGLHQLHATQIAERKLALKEMPSSEKKSAATPLPIADQG